MNKKQFSKRITNKKTRFSELEDFKKHIKQTIGDAVGLLGVYRIELFDVLTGKKEVKFYHNIICDPGLGMVCNNLTDPTPDNDMLISHALLGDDDTAVAEVDTVLGNEVYRNAITSRTSSGKIAYATAYFNQTEVDGTFKEAGLVSDGSDWSGGAGKDTGILISHVNIDVTKSNTQKLTIDWTLTFVNATA